MSDVLLLAMCSSRSYVTCVTSAPVLFREYRSRFTSEETVSFCLRVMVGVIILYDYVHPVGAFAKSSKIDVSTVTSAYLASQPPAQS